METHLPPEGATLEVPNYRLWTLNRTGAQRSSGGLAVLVHNRVEADVTVWHTTAREQQPSPFHLWLRLAGGSLPEPLLLLAAYLPPYRSRYGLKSQQELDDYFALLRDEAAEAKATGFEIVTAGDWNAHTGTLADWADHSDLFKVALAEDDELLLLDDLPTGDELRTRANACSAPPCPQGKALLDFCASTGLPLFNGRVPGDELGSPTCFNGQRPTTVDYFGGSVSVLSRVRHLKVLPQVPEYRVHRPLELILELPPPAPSGLNRAGQEEASTHDTEGFGPPPSFAAALRINPGNLESFTKELTEPAVAEQLQSLATTASTDPLQAASQLHRLLYDVAATAFPPASDPRPEATQTSRALHKRHQPWFDEECERARQHIRQLTLASIATGRPNHLAKEALRAASNRYTGLRRRKAASWQREQGSALLHLQKRDPRKFFKKWRKKHPNCPIPPRQLLQHYVNLQLKCVFKPSGGNPARGAPHEPGPTEPPAPDPDLDADITEADIAAALKKLNAGSATLGPLKASLIKAGATALTPVLARLFTAVFRSGRIPPEWAVGVITSVFKKGDASDPNNYRGITVGHVLGKLYALVLNARLTAWLEARGLRARGQAGFRAGHRTVDHCFTLRAIAERCRANGTKLFGCAVDLTKAFDSVNRELLWAALQRSGIGGTMLQAIQAMYADVPVCVKSSEGLSGSFQSVVGVKQGCPMSPLLFGIFMDDFESYMTAAVGASADWPSLAGRKVPPLLFADDIFLLALSATGLQAQLHALQSYCDSKHLTVNAAKTQVMILRPGGGGSAARLAAGESFEYAGQALQVVDSCKYLGLTFTQLTKKRGFASCADRLARAGQQATFAMRRRAFELGVSTVEQQCRLFDILVKPVLSYGCEIWGVDLLTQADGSSAAERVHRWFCRRVQGLPRQVPAAVSLAELGRLPLHVSWVKQMAGYWNHLQDCMADPDRLLGWAAADNLQLMQEGLDLATGSPCWARRWRQVLQHTFEGGFCPWLTKLDTGSVAKLAAQTYHGHCVAPPQPQPQPEPPASQPCSKFAYYLGCIRADLPLATPSPHLSAVHNARHRISLSRFRTSCHDLRIERERYLPQAIKAPRHERTCLHCAHPIAIEDEPHMVFHCPMYDGLRFEYADLFPTHAPHSIACFLSQDQNRVASFIHECLVLRRRNACMSLAGSESAL